MIPYRRTILILIFAWMISPLASGQTTIEGYIHDSTGDPVMNAVLVEPGTSSYAMTDSSGYFRWVSLHPPPFRITVTSLGYRTQDLHFTSTPLTPIHIRLEIDDQLLSEIVISARRRPESAQDIPIPVAVISGKLVEQTGAFNVNRLKELVPTVQLYSSNPRNTTLNIRGLGSTFGLTNDGIDPGVGFYIDGVYYARPAATMMDFIDVERIEVLRGPQGTLFGKNTTAGAFNITTRGPSFDPGASFEISYGRFGFIQAKSSVTGPLGKRMAGRISFSGTQRDGVLTNIRTQEKVNDLNNLGFRGQLLYKPNEKIEMTLSGDISTQRPNGYAQVVAGVAPTSRAPYRQFNQIISDLEYALPSLNPYDRLIDHDTPWRSDNDLGGVALNANIRLGGGTLTSTTAWRYWKWGPSNDRDFTGLSVLSLSQAPSQHQQWSQEFRYAGDLSRRTTGVFGIYVLGQDLQTDPYHTEESGSAQWRFAQNSTSDLWQTPGLLEGYGIRTRSRLESLSAALFGQLDWLVLDHLHLLPGIRFNLDQKKVDFNRQTYGGLQTEDPALLAIKNSVYTPQVFTTDVEESNVSGQLTIAYDISEHVKTFITGSASYKPVGVNLGGLPTSNGQVLIELARIKPEYVRHFEVGVKSKPVPEAILNITLFNTTILDYQTLVQTAEVGVNRGYLANADKVRVRGIELEGQYAPGRHWSFFTSVAWSDGRYVSFPNAPVPLEETGGPVAFKDISGGRLPGLSPWAASFGGELKKEARWLGLKGEFFSSLQGFYRSSFSSSASPSSYLQIEDYFLLNGSAGFRTSSGLSLYIWGRNLLDQSYMEQLLPAAGNAGHYAGVLGDPVTYGITLRYEL